MEDEPRFEEYRDSAIEYFIDAPLASGAAAASRSQASRLSKEAEAAYVAHRLFPWISALTTLNIVLQSDAKEEAKVEAIQIIRVDYDKSASRRVFGYVGNQDETSRPLSPELSGFLDDEVFSGLIPERFDDVPYFRQIIDKAGLAGRVHGTGRQERAQSH